jgi:hypothetical protein
MRGIRDTELAAGLVSEANDFEYAGFGDGVAGIAQGDVRGDVNDAEILGGEHHREIAGVP